MGSENLLTDEQQFRIDVIEALAAIDTEIDALQQAIEQGKVITPREVERDSCNVATAPFEVSRVPLSENRGNVSAFDDSTDRQ